MAGQSHSARLGQAFEGLAPAGVRSALPPLDELRHGKSPCKQSQASAGFPIGTQFTADFEKQKSAAQRFRPPRFAVRAGYGRTSREPLFEKPS